MSVPEARGRADLMGEVCDGSPIDPELRLEPDWSDDLRILCLLMTAPSEL